jgi:hypothetical protein
MYHFDNIYTEKITYQMLPKEIKQSFDNHSNNDVIIYLDDTKKVEVENTGYPGLISGKEIFRFNKCVIYHRGSNNGIRSPLVYNQGILYYPNTSITNREMIKSTFFKVVFICKLSCYDGGCT